MSTLLVVGCTGFVGSHVARVIMQRPDLKVRWANHQRPFASTRAGDEVCRIDLRNAASLRGIADGVDAVLNLGHRIEGTRHELEATNVSGTANLLAECAAAGVSRFVQLSTAAIHLPGPWQGQDIAALPAHALSPVSASRLTSDDLVAAGGGIIVRPHLVYGHGDRWFTPRAVELVSRLGWIDDGRTRHSLISATSLAERLVHLSLRSQINRGVLFAAEENPVEMRTFITHMLRRAGRPVPTQHVTYAQALTHRAGAGDPRWQHDVALLGQDHWVQSQTFCRLTKPATPFALRRSAAPEPVTRPAHRPRPHPRPMMTAAAGS